MAFALSEAKGICRYPWEKKESKREQQKQQHRRRKRSRKNLFFRWRREIGNAVLHFLLWRWRRIDLMVRSRTHIRSGRRDACGGMRLLLQVLHAAAASSSSLFSRFFLLLPIIRARCGRPPSAAAATQLPSSVDNCTTHVGRRFLQQKTHSITTH